MRLRNIAIALVLISTPFTISADDYHRQGLATHYGWGFHLKRSGASGLKVDGHLPIAASRDIPYGSIIEVENIDRTSSCIGNRIRVMIFDWGPSASRQRIVDLMPDGGFFSYRGGPGIAEKGRGGIRVKVTLISTAGACIPSRVGDERQGDGEYFCLRRLLGKRFLSPDDITWDTRHQQNRECGA